ncbi:MAG TPA: hypothetical protein VNB49_18780 [Candidatus Dormibacteraeota bacterium]|nr:hypothetical protein [Candidatus Dormibacteraeota bacterium]
MEQKPPSEVTLLLQGWWNGDREALTRCYPAFTKNCVVWRIFTCKNVNEAVGGKMNVTLGVELL